MADLDFYADIVASGDVLGLSSGCDDVRVRETLGGDFIDDVRKQRMRRDYGLVEFHFNRMGERWIVFGVSIQVYRLKNTDRSIVPAVLSERFGEFRSTVSLVDLHKAVGDRSVAPVMERERMDDNFVSFLARGTKVRVHAEMKVDGSDVSRLIPGDVWSIELGSQEVRSR